MIDFSAWSHKRTHSNLFAFLLVMGIVGLVGWVVFLLTQKNLAANMRDKHLDLICLVIFVVFTAGALVVYFTTRFRIEAGYKGGVFVLEVNDPSLPAPLVIHDPYILSRQWVYQYVGARKKMQVLYVTVKDMREVPLVTFTCALGSMYNAPMNFEYMGETAHQLVLADKVYNMNATQALSGVLSRHLDNLRKKSEVRE